MTKSGLAVLLLAVVAGYFGLGTVVAQPATALVTLLGVFLAVWLVTFLYESGSRRRWIT
jgi:hypothetical protein